jgi:HD-GYP domain-containing protein (c-di-GMP phosphodiesterase class II)
MKQISLDSLSENSGFDRPVFLDKEYILTSPDTFLSGDLIRRLKKWGFSEIFSDGSLREKETYRQPEGETDAKPALEKDIKDQEHLEKARKSYYEMLTFTRELFLVFKAKNLIDLSRLTTQVKELIQAVKQMHDAVLRFPEFPYPGDNYLFRHSVDTAILSLAVGDMLKFPPHRLIELGNAALLHDIGMIKIPESMYLTDAPLDEKQTKMVRAHTILGYRILKGFSVSEDTARPALEHHERLDGSGYPNGLRGDKISLFSRIVAVACSYVAMISRRRFRSARGGHSALLDLLKQRGSGYDERVIRTLIYCLSVYPLGTPVRLSNQAVGRVVKSNAENPRFPLVQILLDEAGKIPEEQTVLQTSESGGITIEHGLTAQELEILTRKQANPS